jgi:hypothetical protein
MVRYGCVPLGRRVVPDLVTARSLAIESESVGFQLASNLTITES